MFSLQTELARIDHEVSFVGYSRCPLCRATLPAVGHPNPPGHPRQLPSAHRYGLDQLRCDLRKMKAHDQVERDGRRYAHAWLRHEIAVHKAECPTALLDDDIWQRDTSYELDRF